MRLLVVLILARDIIDIIDIVDIIDIIDTWYNNKVLRNIMLIIVIMIMICINFNYRVTHISLCQYERA